MGLSISTLSYEPAPNGDAPIRDKLTALAGENKRFGHPRLFVLLKKEMPEVNHKRSHRIYTQSELQLQRRKRKKLGTHPRTPPTRANEAGQVWAIDFMFDYLESGEFTRVRKPNQIIESFNSRLRDECLNENVFFSLSDARGKIDDWHWRYNNFNPHSALGMKSPIEFAMERETMLAS